MKKLFLTIILNLITFCFLASVFSKNLDLSINTICTRVVDGDTIIISGEEKVRLIGIDTPELHHPEKPVMYYAAEAYKFTKNLCEGKKVKLEYDEVNAYVDHKDKYGRTLAYLYLEDGTFVNAETVKQGYGFCYVRFPFKYMEQFRDYQREAMEEGRGLWAKMMLLI